MTTLLALAGLTILKPGGVFHGFVVNPFQILRSDPTWQQAMREVLEDVPDGSNTGKTVLRHGTAEGGQIALTFDDGPHPGKTEKLLTLLRAQHVKATFFLVGSMAKKAPKLVRMIENEGHQLANHTFSHVNLKHVTWAEAAAEYRACNKVIFHQTRQWMKYCRPPGGDFNSVTLRAARASGLKTVLWTDDPGDYTQPGMETIYRKAVARMHPGGIILLHDGVEQTLAVLPSIIRYARQHGWTFVTIDRLDQESRAASPGQLVRASGKSEMARSSNPTERQTPFQSPSTRTKH